AEAPPAAGIRQAGVALLPAGITGPVRAVGIVLLFLVHPVRRDHAAATTLATDLHQAADGRAGRRRRVLGRRRDVPFHRQRWQRGGRGRRRRDAFVVVADAVRREVPPLPSPHGLGGFAV